MSTLNDTYNRLLLAWADAGHPSAPECEDCGVDLTGRRVHDIGRAWVCDGCAHGESDEPSVADREDFHADG